LLKRLKAYGPHLTEKLSGWAECVHPRMLMLLETHSVLSNVDHASFYHYHSLRTYH
jgi:hypothetical protein